MGASIRRRDSNNVKLKLVSDDEVIRYIDDELYQRILDDSMDSVEDMVIGAFHMGLMNSDRLVGVMTFKPLPNDRVMIHPRVNRSHMIYAKRLCHMALDSLGGAGFKFAYAKFPSDRVALTRMAKNSGMFFVETIKNHKSINGQPIDIDVYKRSF